MPEKVFKLFLFIMWLLSFAIFSTLGYLVIDSGCGTVETVATLMVCLLGIVGITVLTLIGMDVI